MVEVIETTTKSDVGQKTEIKERKPRTSSQAPKNPLEDPVSQKETAHRFMLVFNTIATLVRSNTRFSEEDFKSISSGITDILNLFPPARVILRLLGPLSVIGDVVEKVRRIAEGRKKESNGDNQPT